MIDPCKKTVNVTISVKVNGVEKDITFQVPRAENNAINLGGIYIKWEEIDVGPQVEHPFSAEIDDILYFEWTIRTENVLKAAGIKTLADLVFTCENELKKLPNFGRKSLREVKETLNEIGLGLGMYPELYEKWLRDKEVK